MYIEEVNVKEIDNMDEMIDNSFNGTCFAYSWFLKLKDSNSILKIMDNDKLIGIMPIFNNKEQNKIMQSTMYIPYGGPVIFNVPSQERKKIHYIRNVEKTLINYLQKKYYEINFSIDPEIIDVMPFIRNGFTPEVRYTYKIDLNDDINNIYSNFGRDRKKDIKKANKRNMEFIIDNEFKLFDVNKAMKWETKYGNKSTSSWVKKYINKTIEKEKGMCFVAKENNKIVGGVHIAWDKKNAYILYSYYEEEQDDVAIAFLYYEIFKYLIENKVTNYIDFEGSVFESIENWNISFGAYQSRFYNLHWNNNENNYSKIYDYGEK